MSEEKQEKVEDISREMLEEMEKAVKEGLIEDLGDADEWIEALKRDLQEGVGEQGSPSEDEALSVSGEVEQGGEVASQSSQEPQVEEPKAPQEVGVEPEAQGQEDQADSPEDQILARIEEDPVLKHLSVMSEPERLQWAQQNGVAGMAKLLELQKLEMQAEMLALREEAKKPVLDAIIEEWESRNKEWLEDPELREIAEGLDLALIAKKGYQSYTEMSPKELRTHLEEIEKKISKLRGVAQAEPEQKGEEGGALRKAPASVGDVSGKGESGKGDPLDLLKEIQDPIVLEQALERLGRAGVDKLLEKLS